MLGAQSSSRGEETLLNDPAGFGPDFLKLLLEQYRLYVEMADRVSARRATANSFLLTVNTALVTVYGFAQGKSEAGLTGLWIYGIPAAGLAVSLVWFLQLLSYRNLNTAKFQVIHLLERQLPARLFDTEWVMLERGQTAAYRPLSHLERLVPLIFAAFYILLFWFRA